MISDKYPFQGIAGAPASHEKCNRESFWTVLWGGVRRGEVIRCVPSSSLSEFHGTNSFSREAFQEYVCPVIQKGVRCFQNCSRICEQWFVHLSTWIFFPWGIDGQGKQWIPYWNFSIWLQCSALAYEGEWLTCMNWFFFFFAGTHSWIKWNMFNGDQLRGVHSFFMFLYKRNHKIPARITTARCIWQ